MDFLSWLGLLFIVGAVVACGHKDVLAWWNEEWRRMRADSWEPPARNSAADPAVQRTLARLEQQRRNMERQGMKHLLRDKEPFRRIVTAEDMERDDKAKRTANKVVQLPRSRRPH